MKWGILIFFLYATTLQAQDAKLLEQAIFHKINSYRAEKNLPRLEWNNQLAYMSRMHSEALAEKGPPITHEGIELRFETLKDVFPDMRSFGENVAYNFGFRDPASRAIKGWLGNPRHRKNILGDFTLTGVGVFIDKEGKIYFTQSFGKIDKGFAKRNSEYLPPHNKEMEATFKIK